MKEFCPQSCLVKQNKGPFSACTECDYQTAQGTSGEYTDNLRDKPFTASYTIGPVIYDSEGLGHHKSKVTRRSS